MAAADIDAHRWTSIVQLTPTTHREPYSALSPSLPAHQQTGKIIIITGAGSGIGAAAARVWARAGAKGIVLLGRRKDKIDAVAKEIKGLSKDAEVLVVQGDVSKEEDVERLYKEVKGKWGRAADVLLANAGLTHQKERIQSLKVEEFWKPFEVNTKGLFLLTTGFINAQENPEEPTGTIINVSSAAAGLRLPGMTGYCISKNASQKFVEFVDAEYSKTLRIFSLLPGVAETEITSDAFRPYALDNPELTGLLALYLVQPRADYLKGCTVGVNWDVEEMEANQKRIVDEKLLKLSWLPILPVAGGKGL